MLYRVKIGLITFVLLVIFSMMLNADTKAFKIIDDPAMDEAVAEAREKFLKSHPTVTRLDAAILVLQPDGSWKRGSYNPENVAYPASTVKLAYLASAMHWCRTNDQPYDYLNWCVQPMIVNSDNVDTGHVVDAITESQNYPATEDDEKFEKWMEKRRYTRRFLEEKGLYENQTILSKTYPSNSGNMPEGAEKLLIDIYGRNMMQPKCTASLMLEVAKGGIEPEATDYMRSLLRTDRWSGHSSLGFGLPPGSVYENKIGVAYDTVEDVAYVVLPNGKEFILAAFSNGFVEPYKNNPYPYNASLLGGFCEMLVKRLNLDDGNPPKIRLDAMSPNFSKTGLWSYGSKRPDQHSQNFIFKQSGDGNGVASWDLNVPESGWYEVAIWYPQDPLFSAYAPVKIIHLRGEEIRQLNQTKCGGQWYWLGDYYFQKGAGKVIINDNIAQNTLVAVDSIKITKFPEGSYPDYVIDNEAGPPAFMETGSWTYKTGHGYNDKDYKMANSGDAASATWNIPLNQPGSYDLYVLFHSDKDRCKKSKYTIRASDGSHDVFVDQSLNDRQWIKLGTFQLDQNNGSITLDASKSSEGKTVVADAIGYTLVK